MLLLLFNNQLTMKKKTNYYLKIISEIEKVRKKNNKNWMDILKIAFKYSPDEASNVLSQIYKEDKKLNILAKKLTKKL